MQIFHSRPIKWNLHVNSPDDSQIHDIRSLLKDRAEEEPGTSADEPETLRDESNSISDYPTSLLFGNMRQPATSASLLPRDPEHCHFLLSTFFSNVDPMTRIVHKPALSQRFQNYIEVSYRAYSQQWVNLPNAFSNVLKRSQLKWRRQDSPRPGSYSQMKSLRTFEPLAFAIMYSAVNSMKPDATYDRFQIEKSVMLQRLQRGAELCLHREDVLTTSSFEVLQGFILMLVSCIDWLQRSAILY